MAEAEVVLSERELEVLRLVATGATNREIARDLFVSANTIKVHLRNIFEKLGVQSRTEATLYAIRQGWVVVDSVEAAPEELAEEFRLSASARTATPVAGWQRIYALGVLCLALILLFLPVMGREEQAAVAANPISDQSATDMASAQVETSRWNALANLPVPRARLALAVHDGRIYAIGGDQATGVTGRLDAYDPKTDTWLPGAPKPTPVSNASAAAIDGHIYVPGGCTSPTQAIDNMEIYRPADDSWTTAKPMPDPVCAYALATVADQIYIFGGWDGDHFVDRVLAYDPATDDWTKDLESMPVARGFAAAGAIDGIIYLVGGYDGVQEFADTYAYDVARDSWTKLEPMNTARGGLGVAVLSGKLYAIGGGWESYLATNERYDPKTNTWSTFESPVLGEWRNLGVAALETEIYAIGGWSGDYMALNEAYHALFRIVLPVAQ